MIYILRKISSLSLVIENSKNSPGSIPSLFKGDKHFFICYNFVFMIFFLEFQDSGILELSSLYLHSRGNVHRTKNTHVRTILDKSIYCP